MGEGKAPFIIDNRDSDISEKVQGYLHDYCELSNQFDIYTPSSNVNQQPKEKSESKRVS